MANGLGSTEPVQSFGKRPRVVRTLTAQEFLDCTDEEASRALRYDRPLSVLMLHLEGITQIDREQGREVTKQAVAGSVVKLVQTLRRIDRIGRLGLSEFGILLPETRLSTAETVAVRLRDMFSAGPVESARGSHDIRLNVGVSSVNPRIKNAKEFLMLACAQLRSARRIGNGEICTKPPELVHVSVSRTGSIH